MIKTYGKEDDLTYLEQLRLRIPVAQFYLINGRHDLQRVSCQIFDPSNVKAKKKWINIQSFQEIQVRVLADSNVSHFTLFDHLLQFLPGWIRVFSECEIYIIIFSIIPESNWPIL